MHYIPSFENASVIRKFSILFFAAAILPLLILDYIFLSNSGQESITISTYDLGFTLLFATLGILASFIGMRSGLKRITMLHNTSIPETTTSPHLEHNEISALTNDFAAIQKQVAESLRKLEEIQKKK